MNTLEWIIIGLQFVILGFVFHVWVSVNELSSYYGGIITDALFVLGIVMFLVPVGMLVYSEYVVNQSRRQRRY